MWRLSKLVKEETLAHATTPGIYLFISITSAETEAMHVLHA
jgi:hypothetical protein